MNHHTCTSCGEKIDNGEAVQRTVSFEAVAFHADCYTAWRALTPVVALPTMPAQRPKPTLSERLAAGRKVPS